MFMKTTYQNHLHLSVQIITKAGADPYATFGVRKICVRKPSNRVAGSSWEMTETSSIADFDLANEFGGPIFWDLECF